MISVAWPGGEINDARKIAEQCQKGGAAKRPVTTGGSGSAWHIACRRLNEPVKFRGPAGSEEHIGRFPANCGHTGTQNAYPIADIPV
jgi:hypothetical protein